MFLRRTGASSDERGGIAVLAAIVVATLVLPVMALALTANVREGAAAELQRAAEAGALAGASSIPLGDLSMANKYVGGLISFPAASDPLVIACDQAKKAIQADGRLNDAYSPQGTTLPANFCKAVYSADPTFLSKTGDCVNSVGSLPLLGGLLGILLKPLMDSLLAPILNLVFGQTDTLLPGLLHAGVKVTLTRTVKGPFDSLLGGSATAQTASAQAKRRFKNAIVLPNIGAGSSVNLNAVVGQTVDVALGAVNTINNLLKPVLNLLGLGACGDILPLLADDLGDLLDPPSSGPTIGQVLDQAFAFQEQVVGLRLSQTSPMASLPGIGPLLGALPLLGQLPFYDFVPMCLQKSGTNIVGVVQSGLPGVGALGGCVANASGIFRATLVPVT